MPSTMTNLLYHLVFSTKGREPMITDTLRPGLAAYMGGIIRGDGGVLLAEGGMPDHIHLLASCSASVSVADMLRTIKSKSSKWVNEREHRTTRFAWQTGYGAFTVSQSQMRTVERYIQNQEEHHRTTSFQDEYRSLLRKHGIEFVERYLWG
ncbi:Transposase IS200 like protein [Planctomycetes bacterium Pan216]|uniref:Transposase IS200 like protein n=1 Tax=Kolteria novifilia TaxID=2527975 RepID=A0A518B4M4_9BACT|nr:Transposase IS200 like protein [Planctomycetes bacterium Pan216]